MTALELKSVRVLAGLDDRLIENLAGRVTEQSCADSQPVFTEGDPGDAMFFILAGAVRMEKQTESATGTLRKTIGILSAGDFFGVAALFDPRARPVSATALGATRLLALSRAAFDNLMEANGPAGVKMLLSMLQTTGDWVRTLCAHMLAYDEIGKAIGESRNLEQLLETTVRQLCQATLADWGMVLLREQFGDRLEARNFWNVQLTAAQQEALGAGAGFWTAALRDGHDRLVCDIAADEPFKSGAPLGFETPALLLAPIAVEGRPLGWLVLGGRQPGQLQPNDLNLARGIARQAAQAILNARHREEEQARGRHARQFVRF